MTTISVDGELYHIGIGQTPVVLVLPQDQTVLREWWARHRIFTRLLSHRRPRTNGPLPAIYITERLAAGCGEGDRVQLTIDVRPEKRGNGIRAVWLTRH